MPGSYVCLIGAEATPTRRARPASPSEWTTGHFIVQTPTYPDASILPEPLSSGARLWIWCLEDGEHGHGLGLTGVGVAAEVNRKVDGTASVRLSSMDLYRRPLGFDRFLSHVKDDRTLNELALSPGITTRYLTDPEAHAWKRAISRAHSAIEAQVRAYELQSLTSSSDSEFFTAVASERMLATLDDEERRFAAAVRIRDGVCVVSGCDIPELLDAVVIVPFRLRRPERFAIENGLTLRTDLRRLYDRDLLRIDPSTRTVVLHADLADTEYARFAGCKVAVEVPEIYFQLEAERRARANASEPM